jgi:class 3 adenylate cyclase
MSNQEERQLQAFVEDIQSGRLSYEQAKQRYMQLGDVIKNRYEREVTALSLDVVQSQETKRTGTALDAQLTFDAFRRLVEDRLRQNGCGAGSFTWAGDGLLAIFETPQNAVQVALGLLDALPLFNARGNRLPRPLQVRIGVHTGPMLPTAGQGLGEIASDTFDLAAHLQKVAEPNQMLISEASHAAIEDASGPFVPVNRQLPLPATCFAFPPPSPISTPIQDGRAPDRLVYRPAAVGGIALAAVLVLGGALWLGGRALRSDQAAAPLPEQNLRLEPSGAAVPGNGANPPPVQVVPPSVSEQEPAPMQPPPAGGGSLEPARTVWRSPAASSGIPVQLMPVAPELRWLVSIGISRTADPNLSAPGADADAQSVAQILRQSAAIPAAHTRLLLNEQASGNNIRALFRALQEQSTGREALFVYLAAPAGDAGGRYAFAPSDGRAALGTSLISGDEVSAWLAAGAFQTVVLMVDTALGGRITLPTSPDPGREFALLRLNAQSRPGRGAGLVEALAAGLSGQADLDGDRGISLAELKQYLEADLPVRSQGLARLETATGFGGYLPEMVFLPLR